MDPLTQRQLNGLNRAIQASKITTSGNIPGNYANVDTRISQLVEQKKKGAEIQTNANGIGKELNMYDHGTKLSDQWAQMAS